MGFFLHQDVHVLGNIEGITLFFVYEFLVGTVAGQNACTTYWMHKVLVL